MKSRNSKALVLGGFFWFTLLFVSAGVITAQTPPAGASRTDLEHQLEQMEQEARILDSSLKETRDEKKSLESAKKTIDTEVRRRELDIRQLNLSINKAALDIKIKKEAINTLTRRIETSRQGLSAGIMLLYTYGQENILTLLVKYRNISEFFTALNALKTVQEDIQVTMEDSREDRAMLEQEKQELEEFEKEQGELKALQEVERRILAQKRKEKENLIEVTKGKEVIFQQLLKSKQKDIQALRHQLYYLEKTGIVAEDAVKFADMAAKRTGIRTAFLLALLEVETGKQFEGGVISVGTNVGTGNWKRDMYDCYRSLGKRGAAEAEKTAFMIITSSLGLDLDTTPVSRKPSYGCGGAMGPAQFIPTTWLRFSDKVAELTGHRPPNPWNAEDAFTAAAVFLADAGASSKTAQGEIAAAKTYLSGSARCRSSICRYYSNRIVALSKEIDRVL